MRIYNIKKHQVTPLTVLQIILWWEDPTTNKQLLEWFPVHCVRQEKVGRNDKNERKERSNKNRSRKQSEGKKKELYTEK